MTQEELSNIVRIAAQRALMGAITSNIRLITIGWDDLKELSIRVYYDKRPTDEDVEKIEMVATEVLAETPFVTVTPVECLVSTKPMNTLSKLQVVVYEKK